MFTGRFRNIHWTSKQHKSVCVNDFHTIGSRSTKEDISSHFRHHGLKSCFCPILSRKNTHINWKGKISYYRLKYYWILRNFYAHFPGIWTKKQCNWFTFYRTFSFLFFFFLNGQFRLMWQNSELLLFLLNLFHLIKKKLLQHSSVFLMCRKFI